MNVDLNHIVATPAEGRSGALSVYLSNLLGIAVQRTLVDGERIELKVASSLRLHDLAQLAAITLTIEQSSYRLTQITPVCFQGNASNLIVYER